MTGRPGSTACWPRFWRAGTAENFGAKTYAGDYASIFFEYWRSFLAVERLTVLFGSVKAVFQSYREWCKNPGGRTLAEWFGLE